MTLVSEDLKEGVKRLLERLSSPEDPAKSMGPTVADVKMTGPQASEARWSEHTVTSDEPVTMGGTDKAPPPSSVFVASIGFAENVIFARQAALMGVDFDTLETRVEAQWDRKGLFGIGGADPSITDLMIETKVGTSAAPERVAELVRLTNQRCPMTTTMAKACKIRRRLLVNGNEAAV